MTSQNQRPEHNTINEANLNALVGGIREHLDTAPIMNGCDWFLIREKQQLTVRKDQ